MSYKVGDKVIPFKKTSREGLRDLEKSTNWVAAKKKQRYLYITQIPHDDRFDYVLNINNINNNGDYFNISDFRLYTGSGRRTFDIFFEETL